MHLATREDIKPSFPLEPEALVTLAGTKRAMDVVPNKDEEANEYEITLELHGEIYDEERYQDTPGAFCLMNAAGEEYMPPIPLLKFPMTAGDVWEWEGTSDAGGGARTATAEIVTSEEQVFVCGVPVSAVKSQVTVCIDRGDKKPPIEREMTFYFASKRGLFKRAWGNTSIREPNCK